MILLILPLLILPVSNISQKEISLKNDKIELIFAGDLKTFKIIYQKIDTFFFVSYPSGFIRIYKDDSLVTITPDEVQLTKWMEEDNSVKVIYKNFKGYPKDMALEALFRIYEGKEPKIEVTLELKTGGNELKDFFYPPALVENEGELVIPSETGVLVPPNYKKKFVKNLEVLSSSLTMPWFAVLREKSSLMVILDTPYDANLYIKNDTIREIGIDWKASLGDMGYPRKLTLSFGEDLTYSDAALIYRSYFSKLRKKPSSNSKIDSLLGTLLIPLKGCFYDKRVPPKYKNFSREFISYIPSIQNLFNLGLERAIFHLDGWGKRGYDNLHPFPLPPCQEAGGWEGLKKLAEFIDSSGYILELHDNYRDYFVDSPVFDEKFTIKDRKGKSPKYILWAGGLQSILCTKKSLPFLNEVIDSLKAEGVPLKGYYLDVFSSVFLDECFDPTHPMTREECSENRNLLFEYLREKGFIVGSEDVVSWAVYHIDHSYKLREPSWGIEIPLLPLVFHDEVIMPVDIGNGRDRRRLLKCLLYGAIPLISIDEAVKAYLKSNIYNPLFILTKFHKLYGKIPIIRHEILGKDLERVVYKDGTEIWVDFAKGIYKVNAYGDGWREMPVIPYRIDIKANFEFIGKDSIHLTIKWIPRETLKEDFKIFLHISDSTDKKIFLNLDHYPRVPTSKWKEEQVIEDDPILFKIPSDVPSKNLYVYTGLFNRKYGRLTLYTDGKFYNKYLLGIINFSKK
jgi:hypothetical protein